MLPTYQNSTPPRIPPTFNASVISTEVLQATIPTSVPIGNFNASLANVLGTATLVAGTVTVNVPSVQAGDYVFVTIDTPLGTSGFLSVPHSTITSAVYTNGVITTPARFIINSSQGADTSIVRYMIVTPF